MSEPLPHYCLVCRHALDRWEVDGVITFEHTAAYQGPAHDPVPVPMAELTRVNMACDFCLASTVRWSLLFGSVTIDAATDDASITQRLGDRWASCGQCTIAVEAKDLAGLVGRAMRQFHGTDIDEAHAKRHLTEVYEVLLPTYKGKTRLYP